MNLYEIKTYFVSLLRPIFLVQAEVISRTVKRNTRRILSVGRTSIKFLTPESIYLHTTFISTQLMKDSELFTTGSIKIFVLPLSVCCTIRSLPSEVNLQKCVIFEQLEARQ